jgi:glutamyl-tRNA synthetase
MRLLLEVLSKIHSDIYENKFLCEVDEYYIRDEFNLYGLKAYFDYYEDALQIILSDKNIEDFEFTFEKMAIGGTAFDIEKLNNISKTYFSRKSGVEVYEETLAWAKTHDEEYAKVLIDNKDDMIKFLSIEKDGPRPRKDISKYSEVKEEFSYAIDEFFANEKFSKLDTDKEYDVELVLDYVNNYLDVDCTNEEWFNKVKEFAINNGYAASPKDFKKAKKVEKST